MLETDIAYRDHIQKQSELQTNELSKLFTYYNNNANGIIEHLNIALGITFPTDTLTDFQRNYINIVPKIVDQLAVVYRDPATRTIVLPDGVKSVVKEGEEPVVTESQKLTEYYNDLIYATSIADNQALRYAKLANTSITAARFDKGKIKYKVLPTDLYDIKVNDSDPYKMDAISYATYFGDKKYRVVWTDTEYYMVEELRWDKVKFYGDAIPVDSKIAIEGNTDTKNPYGIIPYAVLRLKEQGNFIGYGMTDLVNGNEQINIILTELMNEHILMGGAGMVFAVNCRLATLKDDNTTTLKAPVKVGRKNPIVLENVGANDTQAPPSLDYVSTDPQILELRECIDWYIKMFAMSKGLNPNSFLAEVHATSGFSKLVDAMEQMELRKDDLEPCRIYEDNRFIIARAINNYHKSTTDGAKYDLQVIPDNAYIQVDFAEIVQPKTEKEQQESDDWNLKHNLISIYDIAKRYNPDLSDVELKASIEKNKAINDLYKVEPIINNQIPQNGQ